MLAREMDAIVESGYVIIGSPDEVAAQLREVANNLNVGHLMLLLQFGDMGKDLAKYNTQLFAEQVMPHSMCLRRLGGPLVAAADGPLGAGTAFRIPAASYGCRVALEPCRPSITPRRG